MSIVHMELLVRTNNPKSLDEALRSFGGLVSQDASGEYRAEPDGGYAVRAPTGNIAFIRFAIESQGYGTVIGVREI